MSKEPSLAQKAWTLTASLIKFAGSGFKKVTREQYVERIETCAPCEFRRNNNCTQCGCWIPGKAWIAIADCPEEFWPKLDDVDVAAEMARVRRGEAMMPQGTGLPEPVPPNRSYVIAEDGSIHGELPHGVPEGWTQVTVGHWAPPWRPCRHRRLSKTLTKVPIITPFCVLVNEHVTCEICDKCEVREP